MLKGSDVPVARSTIQSSGAEGVSIAVTRGEIFLVVLAGVVSITSDMESGAETSARRTH